jgi:uncharacterized membrane protein
MTYMKWVELMSISGSRKHGRGIRRDVLVSVSAAVAIAAMFSAYVLALHVFRGNEPFEQLETSVGKVILLYFSSAILVGLLVGLLLPFARSGQLGAALVGAVAAGALAAMTRVADAGFTGWGGRDVFVVVTYGLLLGIPVGLAYRRIFGD